MGWRFRRSFKIAPGIKINLNKKSIGITFGTKGAHYTLNTKGQQTSSLGIPGTGLYYTETKRISSLNKQKWYNAKLENKSFSGLFLLLGGITNKLINFLNMDNWRNKNINNVLCRPEPHFITATIKKEKDATIPDDTTIINNLYYVIPERIVLSDTNIESLSEKKDLNKSIINVENKNTESAPNTELDPSLSLNSGAVIQRKRKMSKNELDAFLWQCNSVCDAREDSDVNADFNMRLDNPDDLLETGYYYAMKEISDTKEP